jgi:hypothetical protein
MSIISFYINGDGKSSHSRAAEEKSIKIKHEQSVINDKK